MNNRNLRKVMRLSGLIFYFTCAAVINSYAQAVTYHCDCDDILADEYIEFEIEVTGTGPFELCNATSLFLSVEPLIPLPNNYTMTETSPGVYRLEGFAYNNVLPFVQVKNSGGTVVDVNMLTCMKPIADIATTNPGVEFCVGESIALTAGVMIGNILPASVNNATVMWSAPGAIINPPATNTGNLNTNVSYANPGSYIVQVEGETYSGCPFTDDLVITITDPAASMAIDGSVYMCTTQAMAGVSYTVNNSGGFGLNWTTVPNTVTYNPFVTGDMMTGSGSMVTATFPAAGTYTLSVQNANPNSCNIDLEREVVVVDMIDTLAINGSTYACAGETVEYSLNTGSFNPGTVNWSISPTTGVTMTPVGGASDIIDLEFMDMDVVYTLTVTGISPDGCNFQSEVVITVPNDQDGSIACNNLVNVSLNNDCVLELLPDMILEGDNNNDAFTIEIFDATTGEIITDNMITQDQLGHTFMVTVYQRCGENSCWGQLVVEDKSITPLECSDDTFYTTCYNIDDTDNPVGFPDFEADVVATYRPATEDWLLVGFDNCSDAILSYTDENTSSDVCNDPQEITRRWLVTDINNGATSTCDVEIHVNLVDENSIQWPPNYDTGLDAENGSETLPDTDNTFASLDPCNNFDHPNLFCGTEWTPDEAGNPSPDCTGSPTGLLCTNLQLIGYKDEEIPICGSSKKILRRWTVWDACANDEIMHTQIITLMDTQPPLATCPLDDQAYTELHVCSGKVYLDGPSVLNECDDWTYTVKYKLRDERGIIPSEFITTGLRYDRDQNLYCIDNLPFESDSLWVIYEIRDACGNTSDCTMEFELIDDEQPIPACDLNTVVTLNNEGCAYAGPGSFDDHSWDNCGIYQTVVRRMDNRCDCNYGQFDFMYSLGEFNGHAYFLSKTRMHAQKAFDLSRSLDAYTAVINSSQEGTWINDQVTSIIDESYIIGLQGVSNGSAVSGLTWTEGTSSYTNWAASEPVIDKSINADGNVHVFVNPDGTWDAERRNYKEAYYVVEVDADCQWTQQIKFCCADVGVETMVVMRVIDNFGNHNECMVRVDVKDYIGPVITCPRDVTIDCDQDASSVTGQATATDLCGVDSIVSIDSNDNYECGDDFVLITRTWTATDVGNNRATCVQTIRKENRSPFRESNIRWPLDHTFTNTPCSLRDIDPEDLPSGRQEPTWTEHKCSEIAASYEDLLFIDVEGFCQKLVRTWTVVNWCDPDVYWTHNQVIKMSNTNAPSISSASCATMVVTDGEVVGQCETTVGEITAELDAGGNSCAESATWSYEVFLAGNNSANPDRSGDGFIAAATYPYGRHRIVWTVTDDCGNTDSCTKILDVRDSKAPIPYCHSDIVIPLSQDSCVTIWASDLDLGSADDCPMNDVRLSFEENRIETNRTFCCEDLDPGSNWGRIEVQLWVWDPSNNKEYCTVSLTLQDNRNICDNIGTGGKATIAGMIATEELEMVPAVEMTVMEEGESQLNDMVMTGEYAFGDLDTYKSYIIDPFKDDNYMNGVSTLDLVIIQKHILGVEYLDSPYKVIAADVDNSELITAIDLIELRKLILGIYDELPNNDSWRFVDGEHQFRSTLAPFPYPEVINVDNLTGDIMDADFVAVKIGDVNGTVTMSVNDTEIDRRDSRGFDIEINNILTEKGNTRIQFIAGADASLAGFQADFDIDFTTSDLMAFIPLALDIQQENIAWDKMDNEKLLISWSNGADLFKGDVLFEVLVRGDYQGKVQVADQLLRTEAYIETGLGIDVTSINLNGSTTESDLIFDVSQNVPNPFKDAAVVEFTIPERSEVVLTVTDQSGRLIYKEQNEFAAGQNKIVLKAEQINASGVLYYQLSTDTHTAIKKMIIIK